MAHVISLLCDAMEELLLEKCQTEVDEGEASRARVVRAGHLQDDPTVSVVSVLVHPNDPGVDDGWVHEIIKENPTAMQNPWGEAAFRVPMGMYEIGGGELWWRRFTIDLTMFWQSEGLTRKEARDASHLVLGRAEFALKEGGDTFGGIQDEWGETVWGWYVEKSACTERGGPDESWIWDGKVWVKFGTAKP